MVDDNKIVVQALETLEYDGIWLDAGYLVNFNGKTQKMIGWPTDTDLRNFVKNSK